MYTLNYRHSLIIYFHIPYCKFNVIVSMAHGLSNIVSIQKTLNHFCFELHIQKILHIFKRHNVVNIGVDPNTSYITLI